MPSKRASGPSGRHSDPRRKLSASAESWLLWDLAAAHAQQSFAEWARSVLTLAAAASLKLDPTQALEALDE